MTHLEQLVTEWLDLRGYFVRCNVRVGRLSHGGHTGEIDIAAFHPPTTHCLHVECSGDANSWKVRESSFERKFAIGREFVEKEVFPWLKDPRIEQWAVVWGAGPRRKTVGRAKIVTMNMLYRNIARDIVKLNQKGNRVIPEKYPLLRTIQATMKHVGDSKPMTARIAEDALLLPDVE